MLNLWVLFCCLFSLLGSLTVSGNVVLISSNVTLSFEDIEANFVPSVEGSGICGTLDVAEPLDACSPLTNEVIYQMNGTTYPFVLIIRGGCSFEDKVRRAQAAGFKAAIIYDNETGYLVAMAGNSDGIEINAVFVSKHCGETLAKYAGEAGMQLWIVPSFESSAWSIMAISFISLLAMSAVLATCFFVRRHRIRIRERRPRAPHVREFHGISSRLVKAMPSLIFTAVVEDSCTSQTCAICLEDYNVGDKLRVLPCRHKFHATCVDTWLTSWRTFCPVCKHDARTITDEPQASESTPLLSSSPASVSSSSILSSSVRPSSSSSSAIQIATSSSSRAQSVSRTQSISSTPYNTHSLHQSPHLSTSRSSVDLRNTSSQIGTYFFSPNSLGYTSLSPLNSRHMSSYIPSPGNASSSYAESSSRQPGQLHHSESAESFSAFDLAQSLPEC